MKKLIYISGIVSANLMLLGSIFKVQHWPGANILLTLSVFMFCFMFLPFALLSSYKNSSPRKYKSLYIVTYIVFAVVFVGALFKVMHWSGSQYFLIIGVPLPFVLFLPVYLIQTRKEKNYSIVNFMGIMFGMAFVAVFSVLLALNVSWNIMKNYENQFNYNQNLVSNIYTEKANDDNNKNVMQKSKELCAFIESLKNQMLKITENKPENILNVEVNQMESTIPSIVLYNDDKKGNLDELKNKISVFKQSVIASDNASDELKDLSKLLFETETSVISERNGGEIITWENKEFIDFKLIIVLDALTRLESNVKFVENQLISMK